MSRLPVSAPPMPDPSAIPFTKPSLPPLDDVVDLYREVYATGQITNARLVERLERILEERLDVRHCIAVSNCTIGLALVMKALGLRGEIIMPSFTFFATGEAALWNGLTPVFADCQADTWNIDPNDVAHRITPITSAIIGVHVNGNPADVRGLAAVARDAKVKLIYDSAHAMGSSFFGTPVGGFGEAEVFSMSPTTLLIAGEGGIISTNDASLGHRLRAARNYGDLGAYNPVLCGLNARMAEFNAALSIAGIDLLDAKIKRHNEIAREYRRGLSGIAGVQMQTVHNRNTATYKDFSIHISESICGWRASELCAELARRDIPTKRYFHPPLHKQKIFLGLHTRFDRPLLVSEIVSEGIISLPIYPSLTTDEVIRITGTIRSILESNGNSYL